IPIFVNGKYTSKLISSKFFHFFRVVSAFYFSNNNPYFVFKIGCYGLVLSVFHMYEKDLDTVRCFCIHTGNLGFYTDYRDFEVDQLIDTLRQDQGDSISYPLIKVTVTLDDGSVYRLRAVNEEKGKRVKKTMGANVFIKKLKFKRFRGGGPFW
ncbi:NAD kinase, partial [Streptococcus pluranimalium]